VNLLSISVKSAAALKRGARTAIGAIARTSRGVDLYRVCRAAANHTPPRPIAALPSPARVSYLSRGPFLVRRPRSSPMTQRDSAGHATQPPVRGHFSPVRVVPLGEARMLFISGITAGGEAPADTAAQARIVFRRMQELIAQHGGGLQHLTKITTFLTDMNDYAAYNAVRNELFAQFAYPPASATVGTTALVRPECRIEIEAIAVIP